MSRRATSPARAATLGLALLMALPPAASAPKEITMTTPPPDSQAGQQALNTLTDAQLASTPRPALQQLAMQALARKQWQGLALRLPEQVDLGSSSAVPLLVAVRQSAERGKAVPLGTHAVVVSSGIDHFVHGVMPLFPPPQHKIPTPPRAPQTEAPAAPSADATLSSSQPPAPPATPTGSMSLATLDLRPMLPWTPGRHAVRVIVHDWVSDPVQLRLVAGPTSAPAPARSDALPVMDTTALKLQAWAQRSRGEPNRLPNRMKLALSPVLAAPGVALAVPGKPQAAAGPVPVVGTVRLPVAGAPTATEAGADTPLASVRGVMMLTRLGVQTPVQIEMELPLYPTATAGMAEGYFAVDLVRLRGQPLAPAEYLVFFMLAEHLAGPYRLTVK